MITVAKLKKSDIKHVSKLAGLKLTKAEIKKFTKQLSEVVEYIKQLDEVDTSNIESTSQTTGLENKIRRDEINKNRCLTKDEALSGTEKTHNDFFVVPMLLEERSDY